MTERLNDQEAVEIADLIEFLNARGAPSHEDGAPLSLLGRVQALAHPTPEGREAIVQAMWDQAVDGWSGDASAIDPETAADIAMSFLAPTSLRSVEEDQGASQGTTPLPSADTGAVT